MLKAHCKSLFVEKEAQIKYTDYELYTTVSRKDNSIVLKAQLNSYSFQISYYRFLVDEGRDIILEFVKEINQYPKYQVMNLKQFLRKLSLNRIYELKLVPEQVIYEMEKNNQEKNVIKPFEYVRNKYQRYTYIQMKELFFKSRIVESQLKIQTLFFLDILYIFLQQSYWYIQCCKGSYKLITTQAINFLFNFNSNQDIKFTKIYKILTKYVKYDYLTSFHLLVFIHNLLKIRNRVFYLTQYQKNLYSVNLLDSQVFRNIIKNQQQSSLKVYQFCQVAFITYEKQFKDYRYKIKIEIMEHLQKTVKLTEPQDLKNEIIFIKVKYSINFEDLLRVRYFIEHQNKQQLMRLVYQYELVDKKEFQHAIPFIFLNDFRLNLPLISLISAKDTDSHNLIKVFQAHSYIYLWINLWIQLETYLRYYVGLFKSNKFSGIRLYRLEERNLLMKRLRLVQKNKKIQATELKIQHSL